MEQSNMSADAVLLLKHLNARYIEQGYLYAGCSGPGSIAREIFDQDIDRTHQAATELIEAGLLRVRRSDAFNYELSPRQRVDLIKMNNLALRWEREAAHFHPNSKHGEVTYAMQEAAPEPIYEIWHHKRLNDLYIVRMESGIPTGAYGPLTPAEAIGIVIPEAYPLNRQRVTWLAIDQREFLIKPLDLAATQAV